MKPIYHQCAMCQVKTARPELCTDCQRRVNDDQRWVNFVQGAFEVVALLTVFFLLLAFALAFGG